MILKGIVQNMPLAEPIEKPVHVKRSDASNASRKHDRPSGQKLEQGRFEAALKYIDLSRTFRKTYSCINDPHRKEQINYGKLFLDNTKFGLRRAVLNVADDLGL